MDGDPADRGAGQFEHALPPFENLGLGMMLDRLGRRREESAERDIVRPRLARFHGKVPARVTRHAALRLRSQQAARVSGIAIALLHMHAIGAPPLRARDVVVEDKRHVVARAEGLPTGRAEGREQVWEYVYITG